MCETKMCDSQRIKLHFLYCTSFLAFMLVMVASNIWTGQPKFTEFLTNAATMVSLVLGVVAIVYSFISNDGMSRSLGDISRVSKDVAASKDEIGRFLHQAEALTSSGAENSRELREVSNAVDAKVAALQGVLNAVAAQTETLHATMSALPTKMDQLESSVLEAAKEMRTGKTAALATAPLSSNWTEADIKSFLATSPLSLNLLTYACALSKLRGKPVDPGEIARLTGILSANNYTGYLVTLAAVGLLKKKNNAETATEEITQMHSELSAPKIKDYILNWIATAKTLDEAGKAKWKARTLAIEASFD